MIRSIRTLRTLDGRRLPLDPPYRVEVERIRDNSGSYWLGHLFELEMWSAGPTVVAAVDDLVYDLAVCWRDYVEEDGDLSESEAALARELRNRVGEE